MYTKTNEMGTIHISKNVIGNIVIDVTDKLNKKVLLCNSKGKANFNEKKSMSFLEAEMNEEGLFIKIYILVQFGTSISAVAGQIIDSVKTMVKSTIGIEPETVSLSIKGVISKNVSKRDIEVKG